MLREGAGFITSGAILHLAVKNKKVLPDYLTLALNFEVVRQQAERDAGGSIIPHWRIDGKYSNSSRRHRSPCRIAALITKSFALRKEIGRMLNEAKDAEEREIEGR
jgi:type I restriction enzyme S subunit